MWTLDKNLGGLRCLARLDDRREDRVMLASVKAHYPFPRLEIRGASERSETLLQETYERVVGALALTEVAPSR